MATDTDDAAGVHRARIGPGGGRLDRQGATAVEPAARAALISNDPEYVRDVELILRNVVYGVIARFADGDIALDEILPTLERAVYRLTTDNAAATHVGSTSD